MDKKELKLLLSNKTPEQQKVIKYFNDIGGCLNKPMSDDEYGAMISQVLKGTDFKAKALDKIGVDESEVAEIAPVSFGNFMFDDGAKYVKRGMDGNWRSSAYQVTWLFFSANQVYIYQHTFHLDNGSHKETTEEYFYKDVTNFTATSDSRERRVPKKNCKGDVTSYQNVMQEYDRFAIVVPGDKLFCTFSRTDTTETAIKGMKALLREKKNNS